MNHRSHTSRRQFLRSGGTSLPALAAAAAAFGQQADEPRAKLNVLLVLVDDLRPELGCYGNPRVKTPHIDRLAAKGMTFLRSYCQQAASSPSRTALLTGLRPDTTRVYDHRTHFRASRRDAITLPQQFRKHDYETTAFGKVFESPELDDYQSWSIAPWNPGGPAWRSDANDALSRENWDRLQRSGWRIAEGDVGPGSESAASKSWRASTAAASELPDAQTAAAAAGAIAQLKDRPFFIAVGFRRPNLPLIAPERFFDLYPRGMSDIPKAPEPPRDAPTFALHGSEEIRKYGDIPAEGPIPTAKARELIRAYRACVTYTDSQIGVLLDALEQHGVADRTAVAIAGVSGSHLGELGLWNKHSNYEAATHTPLVVRAPRQRNAGRKTEALVESVDLFPSLCAICDIPLASGLEGSSWRGIFDDPKRLWKRAAFSQHPRIIPGVGPGMGYSMRTVRHRYTEWSGIDSPYSTVELYDYKNSRNEVRNIANRPQHLSLVNGLAHMFREGWQGSLPPTQLPTRLRG